MVPASVTDEHVRALAKEILSRDPYGAWRSNEMVLPWLERINDWLQRWNHWVGGLPTGTQLLIIGAMLLVSALLLTHVVWSVVVALRTRTPAGASRPADERPGFAAEAEALAAQGRFLEAAHRLQLATIELLVSQRRLALSRFEANRVLRRRVREASLPIAERRALVALVDRLERGWFRDRAGDADLYGAWRTLHARLAESAGEA
jgi:hypothetical protein